jgi:porphobilinogen synthase
MFPERRLRRLRKRTIQPLFQETVLSTADLVAPLFVDEAAGTPMEIVSMPGLKLVVYHLFSIR